MFLFNYCAKDAGGLLFGILVAGRDFHEVFF